MKHSAPRTGLSSFVNKFKANWVNPKRFWTCVFALWGVLLSGVLASLGGGPGVLQGMRLNALLESKATQKSELETEIDRLNRDSDLLEKSKVAQEREIRRVLGYAAPDEIIFDFTTVDRVAELGNDL